LKKVATEKKSDTDPRQMGLLEVTDEEFWISSQQQRLIWE
jgi:hypothetical protein